MGASPIFLTLKLTLLDIALVLSIVGNSSLHMDQRGCTAAGVTGEVQIELRRAVRVVYGYVEEADPAGLCACVGQGLAACSEA